MSNLTGRPPYQKTGKTKKPPKRMKQVSDKRAAHWRSDEGKAELEYMARVKMLPCVICGAAPPNDAHHCTHGRFGTRKVSGFDTIPLCKAHHQDGPDAIHNGKESWAEKHGPDYGFIPLVRAQLDDTTELDF